MDKQDDAMVDIGKFLRDARENKRESQLTVGTRYGVTISRLENVRATVHASNLDRVAGAYQLTADEKGELEMLIKTRERQNVGAPIEMQIFYQLVMLPEDVRDRIIRAVLAYKSSSGEK